MHMQCDICMQKDVEGDSNEADKFGVVFGVLAVILVIAFIVVLVLALLLKRKGKQTILSVIIM